jgi:hypothetical protein
MEPAIGQRRFAVRLAGADSVVAPTRGLTVAWRAIASNHGFAVPDRQENDMPWTPWIQIENDDGSAKISDLTRITSLTPDVSKLIDDLCRAVYRSASGLTVREKEIVALVTSSFIGCVH